MMRARRWIRWPAVAVAAVVLVTWVVSLGWLLATRAPAPDDPILAADQDRLLRRSCYDCHSTGTRLPGYAYLPVASTLIAWDVWRGRDHLDFTPWPRLSDHERAELLQKALEELREGEMPLPRYLWLHPEAVVSDAEIEALAAAIAATHGAAYTEPPPEGALHEH